MTRVISALILLLASAGAAFALDAQNFNGASSLVSTTSTWENQSGSTMTITVDMNGNVTGTYINNAAGTHCLGTPYPITGMVDGNNIGFVVAWNNATENCNSVTAWAGYTEVSGADVQIVTNWNLAYQNNAGSGSIAQGSDTFTYQPTTSNDSLIAN